MERLKKIDLEEYRTKGSKVFTGRERGRQIREKSQIDTLINQFSLIEISIPKDVMSVNPSFLEELLYNIVKELGYDNFFKRIKFVSESDRYNIEDDLKEAVDRILRTNNALSK
jgi:hypothetical protein